jgi:hypothetical protein
VHNRPLQFHRAIHLPQKPTYGIVDILRGKKKRKGHPTDKRGYLLAKKGKELKQHATHAIKIYIIKK